MESYRVIRRYLSHPKRVLKSALSLEQAQQHCQDPETSSQTCRLAPSRRRTRKLGPWFDTYERER